MVIKNINLETVCGITSTLPENDKPEVAFAGKSNVGKSSLINALMNRKSYARISATPGKTQTINFYNKRYIFCAISCKSCLVYAKNLDINGVDGYNIEIVK